ncbi:hypothetical protein OSTOST_17010, partial [Ostertagia ostertagi]
MVNDLRVYDFRTTEERHSPGCYITSTTWHENGVKQSDWIFEESFIGEDHCVAVGRILPSEQTATERELARSTKNLFKMVTFESLLDGSSVINPLEDEGIEEFGIFVEKPLKPFEIVTCSRYTSSLSIAMNVHFSDLYKFTRVQMFNTADHP